MTQSNEDVSHSMTVHQEDTMTAEENKAIALRFAQIWGQAPLEIIDELASPDLMVSYPLMLAPAHGSAAFKDFIRGLRVGVPDVELEVHEAIAEGDKVASSWTMRGTHSGELNGIPPTGKTVVLKGMSISRLVNGKVVEEYGQEDALGFLQRLGVIPMPEAAPA
jgi:steroid delta-isomerase-like uncharacterized protein